MKHGISEDDWEDYLEGDLPAAERDRVEAHLIGCVPCWEFHGRMAAVTARLCETGAAAGRGHVLPDEKLVAGLRGVYARICAAGGGGEAAGHATPLQRRLDELEAVMTVFCGARAAGNALRAAAKSSPARSLAAVTRENWGPFLSRLTAIAHVLCGRTGASLIFESGRL
jgi:anti-sigma factor RsiW